MNHVHDEVCWQFILKVVTVSIMLDGKDFLDETARVLAIFQIFVFPLFLKTSLIF